MTELYKKILYYYFHVKYCFIIETKFIEFYQCLIKFFHSRVRLNYIFMAKILDSK